MSNEFTQTTTTIIFPIHNKTKKKHRMIRGYGGKKVDHNSNHPMWEDKEHKMNAREAVEKAVEAITGVASVLNQEQMDEILRGEDTEPKVRVDLDKSCLEEAARIIHGNRQDDYGTPEDSFQRIADYWNSYLFHRKDIREGYTLEAKDVAMMMVLFKIARLEHSYTHDSCVDICGYTAIYDNMFDNDKK